MNNPKKHHNRGNSAHHNKGRGNSNHHPKKNTNNSPLKELKANYNFVPLASQIVQPEWAMQASHDIPFSDGLSGYLEYELTTHTPTLVNDGSQGNTRFYRLPECSNDALSGRYAIPGSSLRGVIRSVLEIATFSRMQQLDDKWLGVRDLTNSNLYSRHFTGKDKEHGNNAYRPKSNSGWLVIEGDEWKLYPCSYARISHDTLRKHLSRVDFQEHNTGKKKYEEWLKHEPLQQKFDIEQAKAHSFGRGSSIYALVRAMGRGNVEGELVFSGNMPGRKMEFVFHSRQEQALPVPVKVREALLHLYRDNETWQWLLKNRKAIPVFCLQEEGDVSAMGLTQMFHLPYRHSLHSALRNSGADHLNDEVADFCTTLFGHTSEERPALKGRVAFMPAVVTDPGIKPEKGVEVVLGSPKPSYYPSYIEQKQDKNPGKLNTKGSYKTLMDKDARLRGWKRYPVRPSVSNMDAGKDNVSTILNCLGANTHFKGKISFHNLRPVELGALIWALEWGEDNSLRHCIGMAKALGYGQVSIGIGNLQLRSNDHSSTPPAKETLLDAFSHYMEEQVTGWKKSEQIRSLLTMANPQKAKDQPLGQMSINKKDFANAKKHSLSLALRPPCSRPSHPRPSQKDVHNSAKHKKNAKGKSKS